MHFQFLIEDPSGEALVKALMEKMQREYPKITMDCKGFHGLGKLPQKKGNPKELKTGKLLNDLAVYLDGFNKRFVKVPDYPVAVFVVIDNDDNDPAEFMEKLEGVAKAKNISIDHVFCLAIEEMEAWLLGDETALFDAYPNAKRNIYQTYAQDSICGTWEKLADVVYPGGCAKMKKDNPSYAGIGKIKMEWAIRIGERMDIGRNVSPSFNRFIEEIRKRAAMRA